MLRNFCVLSFMSSFELMSLLLLLLIMMTTIGLMINNVQCPCPFAATILSGIFKHSGGKKLHFSDKQLYIFSTQKTVRVQNLMGDFQH